MIVDSRLDLLLINYKTSLTQIGSPTVDQDGKLVSINLQANMGRRVES